MSVCTSSSVTGSLVRPTLMHTLLPLRVEPIAKRSFSSSMSFFA